MTGRWQPDAAYGSTAWATCFCAVKAPARNWRRSSPVPTLIPSPTAGAFDGIYGVLAGLEVIRTLNDRQIATERALEVVNWTNEEGARFAPAMIASGVFAGVFDLEYGLSRSDAQGISIGEALKQIGYAGEDTGGRHDRSTPPLSCILSKARSSRRKTSRLA